MCPHLFGFSQSSGNTASTWTCCCCERSTLWSDLDELDRNWIKKCCPANSFEASESYRAKVTEVVTEEWASGPESLFSGSQRPDPLGASTNLGPSLDDLIERNKAIGNLVLLLQKEVEASLHDPSTVPKVAYLKERLLDAFLASEQALELFAQKESNVKLELRRLQILQLRAHKTKLIGMTISEGEDAMSLGTMLELAVYLQSNQCQV